MRVCPECSQQNPPIARFCLACGTQLPDEEVRSDEERRVVSVIFVDLEGFTSSAERMDPEDVRAVLSPYHECVRSEIESFGGVVEKFIGDAVMGVFGAPTAFGDDPERAVRAALSVRDSIGRLNGDAGHQLQIRIAVNTGEALVKLRARPELGEAMVAGDVVNTASRLQQAAPTNGILVGAETHASTRDVIRYERAEPIVAKGKAEAIEVWAPVATRPGERGITGAPLVGRRAELVVLRGIWERVVSERRPYLVTILGPAGIGKTRLGVEFAGAVAELGGRTYRGRSLPYRESTAYSALAFQLKQLCRIYESDPVELALRKLEERTATLLGDGDASVVARHLAILLGLDPDSSVDDRETLFFSVRSFVEAVAREQPTMLVFEDVHWADRSLLDLVEELAARLHDLPILLLTLARPELLDARPGWGGGLLAYAALPLESLSSADAEELADQLLRGAFEDRRVGRAAELAQTAEGNPLFIEQLAAALSETSPDDRGALPNTIRGIVAARLDALPPAERSLLLDAAIVGKVFWRGALERMTGEGNGLGDVLAALERRDLVRRERVSSIEGDEQYAFKHMLIRDVAYELLPRARRQEGHKQVAGFLEGATSEIGEAAAAIARHSRDGGDAVRAVEFFVKAAGEAAHGWAKERAAAMYREALVLLPDGDPRRNELRRCLALAMQAALHVVDARHLGRAAETSPAQP
jgi:class 3 adenylate cyclase